MCQYYDTHSQQSYSRVVAGQSEERTNQVSLDCHFLFAGDKGSG